MTSEGPREPRHIYKEPTDEELGELARLREATRIERLIEIARKNLSRDPKSRRRPRRQST